MNLQNFGRELVEVLAERALEAVRGTSVDDVRRMVSGRAPSLAPASSALGVGSALGAFAVGAAVGVGLTALYTPTTGEELRRKLSASARDARKQAMDLGDTVRHQLDDARSSIAHGVGQLSGMAAAPARGRARKHATNGHAPPRASRSKKSATTRAHHDA